MTLYSSKTHGEESLPQKIRIYPLESLEAREKAKNRFFCPFRLLREYAAFRGGIDSDNEPFFIFRNKIEILPQHVRSTLRLALKSLGLDPMMYNTHSLRSGRSCDMFRAKASIAEIKEKGRWKSSTVYRYLQQ